MDRGGTQKEVRRRPCSELLFYKTSVVTNPLCNCYILYFHFTGAQVQRDLTLLYCSLICCIKRMPQCQCYGRNQLNRFPKGCKNVKLVVNGIPRGTNGVHKITFLFLNITWFTGKPRFIWQLYRI